ncbi:hypothetical protein BKA64DRAFT_725175 [Cadophora sp. MPI-SDFR-AT-0126]|nr:hypothetical protein BKA64DRAFT_725175 [Leotiomycetes sp. MPI-SDFR-AT-0126]
MAPPKIHTYHCICTSLLLSSTHTLSSLPRRSSPTSSSLSDAAIIIPLPSTPPLSSDQDTTANDNENENDLPAEGYTVLLGLTPDHKTTLIRREDGFEKRILYRCSRCNLVVGYELQVQLPGQSSTTDMDIDSGKGKEKEGGGGGGGEYNGKVIYILPGGVMSTEVLASGKKLVEEDVGFVGTGTGGRRSVGVWE